MRIDKEHPQVVLCCYSYDRVRHCYGHSYFREYDFGRESTIERFGIGKIRLRTQRRSYRSKDKKPKYFTFAIMNSFEFSEEEFEKFKEDTKDLVVEWANEDIKKAEEEIKKLEERISKIKEALK